MSKTKEIRLLRAVDLVADGRTKTTTMLIVGVVVPHEGELLVAKFNAYDTETKQETTDLIPEYQKTVYYGQLCMAYNKKILV